VPRTQSIVRTPEVNDYRDSKKYQPGIVYQSVAAPRPSKRKTVNSER